MEESLAERLNRIHLSSLSTTPRDARPPRRQSQPLATSSQVERSPFVRPKKSTAIRIVNPDTKAEVTFTSAGLAPERSLSPTVRPNPSISVPRLAVSPRPTLNFELPDSGEGPQPSVWELKEEMKAKIALALIKEQEKKERADEAERRAEEERIEIQKAKEEARIAQENEKRRFLLFQFLEVGSASLKRRLKCDLNCKTMDETHWSTGLDPGIAYQRQIDSGAYADVFQVPPFLSSH
jgi:hypothetical protein